MKSFFTFIVGMIFGMVALIGGIAGAGYWAFTNMTIAQVEELTGTEFPIYEDDPDGVKQMTFEQIVYYAMDVYASIDTYTIEELAAKMGIGGMLPQSIGAFNIDFLYSRTLGDLMGDGGILGILDNITVGDIFGELEGPLAALGDITIGTLMNDPFSVLDSLTLGDLIADIDTSPLASLADTTISALMNDPLAMLDTMTLRDIFADIETTPLGALADNTLSELMADPMGILNTMKLGDLITDIETTPLASLADSSLGELMEDPMGILNSLTLGDLIANIDTTPLASLAASTLGELMEDPMGILQNMTLGELITDIDTTPLAALADSTLGDLMSDPMGILNTMTLGDLITDIESTPLATLAGSTLGDLMSDPMGMLNTMTLGDLITDIESTPLASFASSTLGELMEDPMGMFETITFGELIDDIESTPLASLVDMTIGDLMIDPSTIMDSIISDLYLRDVLDINPATTSNLLQILAYRQFVGIAEDGVVYYEKTATEYELATITTGDSITLTDNIYVPLKVNDIGAKLQLLTLAESIGVTDSSSTMLKSIAYSQTLWNELIDLDADMQYYEKSGENFVIIDYADIELGDTIYEAVIISEVGDRIATLKMQDILDNPLSDPNAHPIMIKIYNANPGITELGAVMDTIISDLYIRDIIDIDPINTVNLLQILAYEQFTGIAEENAIYYEKTATEYVLISKTVGVTIIAADNIYVPLKVQDIGTKLGALTLSEAVGVNDDSCMIIKSMAYYEVSWSVLGDIDAGTQYFEKVSGNYIKLNYQDIEVGDVIYQELLISDMDTRASSLRISDLIGAPVVDVVSGKYEGVWAIFEVDDGLGGVTVLDPLLNNFAAAMTSAFNPNSLTCERLERISQIDMDLSAELEGKTVIEIIEDYNDFNAFLAENPAIAALYEDYISNP